MASEIAINAKTPKEESEKLQRQAAIQRRLDKENKAAEVGAKVKSSKMTPKGGKFTPTNYQEKYIKGEKEGFTKSDYGVGAGAAIPYQIGSKTKTYKGNKNTANKGTVPTKPKQPVANKAKLPHKVYTVKRGDNLSSIAKKHNTTAKDIWDYNLKSRSASTVKTLKKRGPNLIYKGGTFYIPNK